MNNDRKIYVLPNGSYLTTHTEETCTRKYCPLHNPSDHHMVDWPQNWCDDLMVMERICEHGVGHPDPDQVLDKRPDVKEHSCDGCCVYVSPFIEDVIELMQEYSL